MATEEEIKILIAIAQLDTKVEMALLGLTNDVNDHEQRIRTIEKRLFAIPGLGVLISIGGFLWQVFGH